MYLEKRPTCVTVIGWVWIILGGLTCLFATMALFMSIMMGGVGQDDPDKPFIFDIFPYLSVVQIGVAVLGLISGIHFLRLRSWARSVLECLTWLGLVFTVGFMVVWLFGWGSMAFRHGPPGFAIMGVVMAIFITAMYAVPLGIMLKYLRGPKVRAAMNGSVEPEAWAGIV